MTAPLWPSREISLAVSECLPRIAPDNHLSDVPNRALFCTPQSQLLINPISDTYLPRSILQIAGVVSVRVFPDNISNHLAQSSCQMLNRAESFLLLPESAFTRSAFQISSTESVQSSSLPFHQSPGISRRQSSQGPFPTSCHPHGPVHYALFTTPYVSKTKDPSWLHHLL